MIDKSQTVVNLWYEVPLDLRRKHWSRNLFNRGQNEIIVSEYVSWVLIYNNPDD